MTQGSLASRAGVAVSTVNQLERGFAKDLQASTLFAIATALGTVPDNLLPGNKGEDGTCARCAAPLDKRHTMAECMAQLSELGWGNAQIAAQFGISERATRQELDDRARG